MEQKEFESWSNLADKFYEHIKANVDEWTVQGENYAVEIGSLWYHNRNKEQIEIDKDLQRTIHDYIKIGREAWQSFVVEYLNYPQG